MNTNKLLSYLLYALLAGLIIVAGYKACQMKADQARVAQEDADFQKTLRDFGYVEDDTTGSGYSGEDNASYTDPAPNTPVTTTTPKANNSPKEGGNTPKTTPDGIEYDTPKPVVTQPKTNTPKSGNPTSGSSAGTSNKSTDSNYSDGRYRVVAGSFTVMDGARREMERLIKMGYHDAEIGRYNRGKYAVVIVKRTNDLNEANRIVDQLERKGIDASVVDRQRK